MIKNLIQSIYKKFFLYDHIVLVLYELIVNPILPDSLIHANFLFALIKLK